MAPTVAIVAGVLAALCAAALLWSRWPAALKALLVLGVSAYLFVAYDVLRELGGLPSDEPLPPRFVLLASVIEEPAARRAGALYLWVHAIEDGRPAAQPRAYRLPYAKDLHAVLNDATRRAREGVTQIGTTEPKRGRGSLSWLRPGRDEQVLKIGDMPSPQLPEK